MNSSAKQDSSLQNLSDEELISQYHNNLQQISTSTKERKIYDFYPDEGPLRRELYTKHLEFFAAGVEHRERCMLAANRVGKTEGVGGFELTLHLTGLYPDWWKGRRFAHPVSAWAAGDTSQTVRDIIQTKLLGEYGQFGTGLIPGVQLLSTTNKAGSVAESVEGIKVRHSSGGVSRCTLKSYDQKRKSFQGTEQDIIWLDEEPPMDIYTECLLRTMGVDSRGAGMVMCTFTPLLGLSEVVLSYLPGGRVVTD